MANATMHPIARVNGEPVPQQAVPAISYPTTFNGGYADRQPKPLDFDAVEAEPAPAGAYQPAPTRPPDTPPPFVERRPFLGPAIFIGCLLGVFLVLVLFLAGDAIRKALGAS